MGIVLIKGAKKGRRVREIIVLLTINRGHMAQAIYEKQTTPVISIPTIQTHKT